MLIETWRLSASVDRNLKLSVSIHIHLYVECGCRKTLGFELWLQIDSWVLSLFVDRFLELNYEVDSDLGLSFV